MDLQKDFCTASRVERGEIICNPWAPFDISESDLSVLRTQELTGFFHKNISYTCETGAVSGSSDPRLKAILQKIETSWFASLLKMFSSYAPGMKPSRLVLNNTEAATRKIRLESRDDLLHFDIPSNDDGSRVLKCHLNLDQNASRVWAVGPTLKSFFSGGGLLNMLANAGERPLWKRLHHAMKRDALLQGKPARTIWRFPPNSHWLAMTDGLIHGTLRGAGVLEFHVVVNPESLQSPECHPVALWRNNIASNANLRVA